jgi:hypothetical protein
VGCVENLSADDSLEILPCKASQGGRAPLWSLTLQFKGVGLHFADTRSTLGWLKVRHSDSERYMTVVERLGLDS